MVSDETFSSAAPIIISSGSHRTESDLPKSIVEYYTNIEKVLLGETLEDNDRPLLEEKVVDQLESDGVTRVLFHWDCSRVIERLLVGCVDSTLRKVTTLILPDTIEIACHSFASHVLELVVKKLTRHVHSSSKGSVSEFMKLSDELIRKLCVNVSSLSKNAHGSYLLRVTLQALAGVRFEDKQKSRKRWEIGGEELLETTTPHSSLRRALHKFTKRLLKENPRVMMDTEQGAPLVSTLLLLLHRTEGKALTQLKEVILTSFEQKESEYPGFEKFGALPAVVLDSKSSFVVQSLIKVLSKEELQELYDRELKSLVVPLSLHSVGNYTVQTLLDCAPSKATAEEIVTQVVGILEDLLAESATGVVVASIRACHRYSLSVDVVEELRKAFHLPDEDSTLFFRCLMSMTTHDVLLEKMEAAKKPTQSGKPRRDRFEATLTGSLLLQALFSLGKIDQLEEGVCGLSEDHIVYLCTNVQSSHAIQAFLSSLTVPSPAKHRFIKSAAFVMDKLAVTAPGSHIVEAAWSAANTDLKGTIAQVLVGKEQAVRGSKHGAIVWRNCHLREFRSGGVRAVEDSERRKKRKVEQFLDL